MKHTAYLCVLLLSDGTWTKAGIYSSPHLALMLPGAWAVIDRMDGVDYDAAEKAMRRSARARFPWLKLRRG